MEHFMPCLDFEKSKMLKSFVIRMLYSWFAMTSSKIESTTFLTKFVHNVNNLVLKGLYKFQVDIPINERVTDVHSLENFYTFIVEAAMAVGKRVPSSLFSHMT